YLAGSTTSPAFPGTTGGAQPAIGGSKDAFVAELNPDMSQLIQATYLGGTSDDSAISLAVAPASTSMAGDVYVVGTTRSADFPITSGGAQTTCGGGSTACQNSGDAFVSALSPDLKTLVASSYLGGSSIDEGHAISIAPYGSPDAGQVYVAGRTLSASFPFVSSASAQPAPASASNYQAFVAKFSANLGTANATYLGGNGTNEAYAITVAPTSGTVYVAGDTSAADFPCTNASGTPAPAGGSCGTNAGAGAQTSLAGGFDAYVSELNPGLTKILQSTYLGGSDVDDADAIAIAPASSSEAGQVYAGGLTYSANFPGTAGGAQPALAGSADGFITRLSPSLNSLGQTTYLGGSGNDTVQSITITGSGIYAAGTTASSDFPCTTSTGPSPAGGASCAQQHSGAQYSYGGGSSDGFVALLDPALTSLEQATYFGGDSSDVLTRLALAPASSTYAGDVLIGGGTQSSDLPATTGSAEPASTGSEDAFVAAISPDLQSPQVTLGLSYSASSTSVRKNKTVTTTITVTNNSSSAVGTANKVVVIDVLNEVSSVGALAYSNASTSQGTCSNFNNLVDCAVGNLAANGGSATITVVAKGTTAGTVNGTISVSAYQALDPNSTSSLSQKTTVTKATSSSGGGGFEWPALLLLALVSLMAYGLRRRRTSKP
ncbi:MAG TPA: hypothetical protein VFA48_05140, partial [Gammaproteobacteria bacterium]|nr:hypothetical protein [Gammaproteobacteria bacterium]